MPNHNFCDNWQVCDACQGKRFEPCYHCDGTGCVSDQETYSVSGWSITDSVDVSCGTCEGDGVDRDTPCDECNGVGGWICE